MKETTWVARMGVRGGGKPPAWGLRSSEERNKTKEKGKREEERRKRLRRKAMRFYTLAPVGRRIIFYYILLYYGFLKWDGPLRGVIYETLPNICIVASDEKHYARLAHELGLPVSFVGLLDICKIAKLIQLWCRVHKWASFPFCCLAGTCRTPLKRLAGHGGRYVRPGLGHTMTAPEDYVGQLTRGVIDLENRRFNWHFEMFGYMNIILRLVTRGGTAVSTSLFMSFLWWEAS